MGLVSRPRGASEIQRLFLKKPQRPWIPPDQASRLGFRERLYGNRAKQFTSSLAFGKAVTLRILNTDRYRRPVAVVILPDGSNLNHRIVF